MNVSSKKLLSLLVVVTLVLSMVPAISLQADAAFDPATSICEHCGKFPEGGWTALSARQASLEDGHYYLTTDISDSGSKTMTTVTGNVCLELNGKDYTNGFTSANAVGIACTGGTLAIMDRQSGGRVNADSSDCKTATSGAVVVNGGDVYLYGGTFRGKSSSRVAVGANAGNLYIYEGVTISQQLHFGGANIYMYGGTVGGSSRGTQTGTFRMYGGTFSSVDITSYVSPCCDVTTAAPYTVTVKAAGHTKSGAGTVISTASCQAPGKTEFTCSVANCGAKFYEETAQLGHSYTGEGGVCVNGCGQTDPGAQPALQLPTECKCGATGLTEADWVALNDCTGFSSPSTHTHYYLAEDVVTIGGSSNIIQQYGDVCLYLNGNTLEGGGRFRTRGFKLHIFGEGAVTRVANHETTKMFESGSGMIYLHSGTYTNEDTDVAMFDGSRFTISGGTFNERPNNAWVVDGKWAVSGNNVWTIVNETAAAIFKADSQVAYDTAAAAVTAYDGTGYIQLGTATEIELTKDAFVADNNQTVTVTGTGMLKPVSGGTWVVDGEQVVRDNVNPVTGKRYLTVTKEGTTTSYVFNLKMTQVVLRAGTTSNNMGLYYKAAITTGEELAGLVEAYGAVFSLVDAPTAEFLTDADSRFTMIDGPVTLTDGTATMTSGSIFGIMAEDTTDKNAEYGVMPIYANAYVAIDLDGDGNEEYVMASNSASKSLKDVMVAINGMDAVPEVVKTFYSHWAQYGMDAWASDLGNITAA